MSGRLRLVTLACAGVTFLSACCAATAHATAHHRPRPTGRHAVHVDAPGGGLLSPRLTMPLTIALRERHPVALTNFIQQLDTPGSPEFGHPLTPAQFVAHYSPTVGRAWTVVSYLRRLGFREVALTGNRLFITARASVGQAKRAFDVRFRRYRQGGRSVFANVNLPTLPPAIAATVSAVLGLGNTSNFALPMESLPLTATTPPDCSATTPPGPQPPGACYYTPVAFRAAYDTGSLTGSGTSIAIMAEGRLSQTVRDLRRAERAFGEPSVPYTIERVGRPSTDVGSISEWNLDTQYATAMAPEVSHLYLYDARGLSDGDVALELNRWVSQDLSRAASVSFGECESLPRADGLMTAGDEIMREATAQGQTLFAASGDSGGQRCRVLPPGGRPRTMHEVSYPCSSEYVVCVGGTALFTNPDGSYGREVAWHRGGGGVSRFEATPPWQHCFGPGTPNAQHGEPDIAMDAAINRGAEVYFGRQKFVVGGTSLAAPLALGAWADIESAAGNALGPASALLYRLYPTAACSSGLPAPQPGQLGTAAVDPGYPFHDVTLGSTGAFPAMPGWDYATGLGSIDVARLSAALTALSAGQ